MILLFWQAACLIKHSLLYVTPSLLQTGSSLSGQSVGQTHCPFSHLAPNLQWTLRHKSEKKEQYKICISNNITKTTIITELRIKRRVPLHSQKKAPNTTTRWVVKAGLFAPRHFRQWLIRTRPHLWVVKKTERFLVYANAVEGPLPHYPSTLA